MTLHPELISFDPDVDAYSYPSLMQLYREDLKQTSEVEDGVSLIHYMYKGLCWMLDSPEANADTDFEVQDVY